MTGWRRTHGPCYRPGMQEVLRKLKHEGADLRVLTLDGKSVGTVNVIEVGEEVVVLGYGGDDERRFFVPFAAIASVEKL